MIGDRVRLAREACRLTQQALADLAGLSQGSVSDIESGRVVQPSDEVIQKLAQATHFPMGFFHLGRLPDLPEGHFRRLAKGPGKVGKQIRAQVRGLVETVQRAEPHFKLPAVSIVPVKELAHLEAVEQVAETVRQTLRVGEDDPIPNLTRAVERAGVVIVRLAGPMDYHDSYSAWPDFPFEGRPIIALSDGHPGDRDRFNVAHELGHLVLHTQRLTTERKQAEAEAHRFAGALLLPKRAALADLKPPITLRVLMGVKQRFGISIAAVAKRALDLNRISRAQFVSLRKQLSARQWTKAEPVEVPQERPLLIVKVVEHLGGTGSVMERAARLHMPLFTYRSVTAA